VFVHGKLGKDFHDIEEVKKIAVAIGEKLFHSDIPLTAPWAHHVYIPSWGLEGYVVVLLIDDRL